MADEKKKRTRRKPPIHYELPVKPPSKSLPTNPEMEDNFISDFVGYALEFIDLERVDFKETSGVQERLVFWLKKCEQYGIRPTIIGMADALGIHRSTLYQIVSENYPNGKVPFGASQETVRLLQKIYQKIAESLESGMTTGKVNPVSAMFLLKNHLGYTDTNEIVVRRGQDDGDLVDVEAIRQRYQKK